MNLNILAVENKPISIKVTIPTNVYFLSGIRNFTLDIAQNVACFDKEWSHRFQTVVDELTNNAICYGGDENSEIEIEISIEKHKSMTVTVSDSGTGKNKTSLAQLKKIIIKAKAKNHRPSLDLHGRGLQIVSNWSDELHLAENENGGISITAKKNYIQKKEPLPTTYNYNKSTENVFVLEV